MKTSITTLLASLVISLSASAAPHLLIETTISKHKANGDKELLGQPSVIIESGNQGSIESGKLKYALTPTLDANGTVEIEAVITERNGEKVRTIAKPRMIVELGKVAEIKVGELSFTVQPSLAKRPKARQNIPRNA